MLVTASEEELEEIEIQSKELIRKNKNDAWEKYYYPIQTPIQYLHKPSD